MQHKSWRMEPTLVFNSTLPPGRSTGLTTLTLIVPKAPKLISELTPSQSTPVPPMQLSKPQLPSALFGHFVTSVEARVSFCKGRITLHASLSFACESQHLYAEVVPMARRTDAHDNLEALPIALCGLRLANEYVEESSAAPLVAS